MNVSVSVGEACERSGMLTPLLLAARHHPSVQVRSSHSSRPADSDSFGVRASHLDRLAWSDWLRVSETPPLQLHRVELLHADRMPFNDCHSCMRWFRMECGVTSIGTDVIEEV
jgi:hypothetical protein